jgi:hypothetical protein
MGIGGTFSCLEPAPYNGSIRYTKKSGCPLSTSYPNHKAFDAACPKNASRCSDARIECSECTASV